MRIIKDITNNTFLNLKEVKDLDKHVSGYQFAERKGVDSVAFICYDRFIGKFLLNKEYKPPIDEFILGAFGGSLDKDKTPEEIVLDEVKEEAGFSVTKDNVDFLGKVFVSTQMNQFCYLYLVGVNKKDQKDRDPENEVEAMAETVWVDIEEVKYLEDWKAITIIAKSQVS